MFQQELVLQYAAKFTLSSIFSQNLKRNLRQNLRRGNIMFAKSNDYFYVQHYATHIISTRLLYILQKMI